MEAIEVTDLKIHQAVNYALYGRPKKKIVHAHYPHSVIVKIACEVMGTDPELFNSTWRKREMVWSRRFACVYYKKNTAWSLETIGHKVRDDYDHATVLHHINTHRNLMETDKVYRFKYDEFLCGLRAHDNTVKLYE